MKWVYITLVWFLIGAAFGPLGMAFIFVAAFVGVVCFEAGKAYREVSRMLSQAGAVWWKPWTW